MLVDGGRDGLKSSYLSDNVGLLSVFVILNNLMPLYMRPGELVNLLDSMSANVLQWLERGLDVIAIVEFFEGRCRCKGDAGCP